ncbi:response regulator [Coprococcus eutactus]|jgi:signal transduction histidine kinase/CheY-like chemotaxis protein|nr:response regulator [Coprococcus eutactus]
MVKRAYKRLVFYISIFVILMAGVILIFCAREIRETTEQVDDEMNNNIDYAAMSCQNCLSDAIDILTVNYFTVQYMHESGYSMDEFRTYFTEQTDYLKNEESMQYLGIYGYIDGELMLSTAWEQPEGYRIEDRSWYQEMKQNGTELTITTPYLDMKTNRQVVSVGRMFQDGSNLIGVDVDLEDLSNLLKELDAGAGEIYIVDQTGSIIAGENPAFMGKTLDSIYHRTGAYENYVSDIDKELASETEGTVSYKTDSAWISVKPILDNWYVVAIVDKNEVSKLAAKNAIPSAVTLTVVLLVFFMLYMNLFVRVYRTGKKGRASIGVERYASGSVLQDDKRVKKVVFYVYILFATYFIMMFYRFQKAPMFVIVTLATMLISFLVTFIRKTTVKIHGLCMSGCLFAIVAMYGLIPGEHNRLTDMFLAAAVVVSLYQKMELNIFMLISTIVYYLYMVLAGRYISQTGSFDVSETILDLLIILIGSLMLLVVIAWNKQLQVRLKQKAEEAETAANSKSAFLANISHEIRTPLNAILGMNELVLRESRQPHIKEYAMYIKNSGKSLLTIISDILDLSKIESGKVYLVNENYSLSSLVEDVERSIQKRIMEKGLELKIYVEPELHENLKGDEVRIKQIIMNLLTNAVKYTEKGEVRLYITGTVVDNKQDLTIEVSDTGIGMRSEDMDKLFTNFERLDLKRNRSVEGTGLGLPITKNLLVAMGGDITVSSVYGEGSTFTATVGQEIVNEEQIGDYRKKYKEKLHHEVRYHESFHAEDARILVVDDNEVNLKIVVGLAKNTKLQIDTALSAAEGLKLIRQHSYQLLLIDHMMPEMDGIEMLQHVKTMDGGIYKDIPAVAITANALSGAKQTYLDAGFCGYLSKPIDPERFEQIIKDNLPQEYVTECGDGNGDTATEGQETDGTSDPKQEEEWSILGIDIAKALSYIGGSRELYISLLQTYLDGSEERIRKLEECKNKEDIFNYDITIHGLKGISASIGADSMAIAAAGLEEACKDPQTAMTYIQMNHDQVVSRYRELLEQIKKWLANIETDGKIEKEAVTNITEMLTIISDLKTAVFEYKEKAACTCLERLYKTEIPELADEMGAKYYGILDKLYQYVSDYDMDKAYELAEKLETDIRRILK